MPSDSDSLHVAARCFCEVLCIREVRYIDKDVRDGVHDTDGHLDDVVFIKAKEPVMSPYHGIDDKEASKLASPVSLPPSPLEPINIFGASNLKGRLHKTLLQSWQDAHGSPFKPTANASSMRIPRI